MGVSLLSKRQPTIHRTSIEEAIAPQGHCDAFCLCLQRDLLALQGSGTRLNSDLEGVLYTFL